MLNFQIYEYFGLLTVNKIQRVENAKYAKS
jgi:hypothetical protein